MNRILNKPTPSPTDQRADATGTPAQLRRRWRAADHDQRRRLIVDVAVDLLHRKGLQAVTMRRVADRLGVGAMTLYTYTNGQDELRRQMILRGFELLHAGCSHRDDMDSVEAWRAGANNYLRFALTHPNLYRLMFSTPIETSDIEVVGGGFNVLLDRVREHMAAKNTKGDTAELARIAAGRFWIALHGLASLAIDGRLAVLNRPIDDLLDELLTRVAPV